ncbi:hypothetical protein HK098_000242 [Nowakowskiella sp. JEL0407]|nr:hypothetical protein HK098_000236 [Nowakowskiella sp. JEL0407]KAJ3125489.1 hypothetical protein HK098_000242 [Nowakowskiella sp. JEL0407]
MLLLSRQTISRTFILLILISLLLSLSPVVSADVDVKVESQDAGVEEPVVVPEEKSEKPVVEQSEKTTEPEATDEKKEEKKDEQIVPPELNQLNDDQLKDAKSEKFKFEAEVNRMMKLIINSLYKTKEIFLREIISNASDALDKIRFISLTNKEALGDTTDLKITIVADKEKKAIIIRDTGVGMTKKELVANLGTIAKSGTSEFLNQMENNKTADMGLIGQFGVGFYSVYLVADRVTVVSKNNNDPVQHIWQSDAENDFTIIEDPRGNTLGRGTEITIHLKDSALEYLDENKLKGLIHKYSEFINFEIYLWTKQTKWEEVAVEPDEVDQKQEEDSDVEDADDLKTHDEPQMKNVKREFYDWELMNSQKPVWTRSPKEVNETEYKEFFKSFSKSVDDPATWIHFKAEGEVDFKAILYVPQYAPPNFYQNMEQHLKNLKLFVRRVFITDELLDLLPKYLSFLHGLVDSDDLPLNVSRETLQHNAMMKLIRKRIIAKALEMLKTLSKDAEKYNKFFKEFGTALKLGVIEDTSNKKKLTKLLRFPSSYSKNLTGLEDYAKRMKKGQPQIYYMTGTNLNEIKKAPFVEKLLARGYEVLFMPDPMDEFAADALKKFEDYPLQNVAKSGLLYGDEDDDTNKKEDEIAEKFKPLGDWLIKAIGDFVDTVKISNLLTKSPCAVFSNDMAYTGNMERVMMSQAFKGADDPIVTHFAGMKKVLHINPDHPIIINLLDKVMKNETTEETKGTALVLYEMSLLRSGFMVRDLDTFTTRVENVIRENLGVTPDEKPELDLKPAPEKEPEEEAKEEPTAETTGESEGDEEEETSKDGEGFTIIHDDL